MMTFCKEITLGLESGLAKSAFNYKLFNKTHFWDISFSVLPFRKLWMCHTAAQTSNGEFKKE
jgi:hypothetical protein